MPLCVGAGHGDAGEFLAVTGSTVTAGMRQTWKHCHRCLLSHVYLALQGRLSARAVKWMQRAGKLLRLSTSILDVPSITRSTTSADRGKGGSRAKCAGAGQSGWPQAGKLYVQCVRNATAGHRLDEWDGRSSENIWCLWLRTGSIRWK